MKDDNRNPAGGGVPSKDIDSSETTKELYDTDPFWLDEPDPFSDFPRRKPLPAGIKFAYNPCSDVANAQRLYWKYGNDWIFVTGIGWVTWEGRYWRPDDYVIIGLAQNLGQFILSDARCETDNRIAGKLYDWSRKCESRSKVENAASLLRPYLLVDVTKLDSDPYLLNVINGTLNLQTGELRHRAKKDYITRLIDLPFDPHAKCPLFLETLDRVLGYDESLIQYFQRVSGYCLTGSVREQVLFILYGIGANGKSTIVSTLMKVLGSFAKPAAPNLLLSSSQSRHPTELADLKGARLVVAAETPENGKLNENLVKQLTGGDVIKARYMRQDFFEFQPTHKLMIMTNHKPTIQGSDFGTWRRIHLIPFTVVIPPEEQDQELPKKLKQELPGILRWCIQGCADWLDQGLNPPDVVTAATAEYRQDQDVFSRFLVDCCAMRREKQVRANVLYKRYQTWCQECGELAISQVAFWNRLSEKGITKSKTSMGILYHGVEVNQQF